MPERPAGTVSLLFTDIEGSTRLLRRLGDRYAAVLEEHRRVLRQSIAEHHGREVDNQGDALFAAFPTAREAVAAAVSAQRALCAPQWPGDAPVLVRMGIHTGEPTATDEGYVGMDLHRGARICSAGHGGQILVSRTTHDLLGEQLPPGCSLRDLGEHRLKDIAGLERLYQVVIEGLPAEFPPLRSVRDRPSNLPAAGTPLIGRQRELADVTGLLRSGTVRVLTLTGPGGTGKTRLARAAGAALLDDFPDGVFFVALETVEDPSLITQAIARTLGIAETGGGAPEERLREGLRDRSLLLLLDNLEQLVPGAGPVVAGLLGACPRVKALLTSREALRLSGEQEYPVAPLPLADAVALFEQRARATRPSFTVTSANESAIADVCSRLDGLPLAVELAAARVKVLSPEALSTRLQRRLHLLTGGARDLPLRQQTLRAAIDWSHDLLDPPEQRLFARLSVFTGGCTLESAEAVCDPDGDLGVDLLDAIASLVDKSLLVTREPENAEPRFVMLQTIHEYAAERLAADDEAESLAARHAAHFTALAEEAEPQLWRAGQERWFRRLDLDHDNLRAALSWALSRPDPETAQRLAGALGAYWEGRGHIGEAHRWLDAAMAAGSASPSARARALMAKSRLVLMLEDDAARARPLLEDALALLRAAGEDRQVVVVLSHLAVALRQLGEHDRADARYEKSVDLARRQADGWALALALNNRGSDLAERRVDLGRARSLLEESLALRRQLGEKRGIAVTLDSLGRLALLERAAARARPLFEESLMLARDVGLVPHTASALAGLGLAAVQDHDGERAVPLLAEGLELAQRVHDSQTELLCLAALARVAVERGEPLRGAHIWGAAERLRHALGSASLLTGVIGVEWLDVARKQLDVASFEEALTDGAELTPAELATEVGALLGAERTPGR